MSTETTIESLNLRLTQAREAYYAGEPIMTDAEYDTLERQLAGMAAAQLGPAPSVLTTVGTDSGGRIPHKNVMRSIKNKYSYDEVAAWAEALGWPRLTLGPKYDGVSCSLTYEHGELVKAVTRGDGDAGESILDQIVASSWIPKRLGAPLDVEVRGELIIKRSRMLELNAEIEAKGGKPFVSTRNLVAGTIKLKDLEEVKKRSLQFMPWEVLCDLLDHHESGGDMASQRIIDMQEIGFSDTPPVQIVTTATELQAALNVWIEKLAEKEPEIGMDGVVIKVDSCAMRRELGYDSKFANFQVAFKAQNARDESVLREVIWQVGRQGRLTPVGVIDPVVLAGATIERVTLNNLTWIRAMGLEIGSRVEVVRSGDVIPQITGVVV